MALYNPYRTDFHCHTVYSGHSSPEATVENMMRAASEAGMTHIVILEHLPVLPPHVPLEEWRGQAGDRSHIDRIRDEIRQARKQAPDVEVLLGAEIDADPWAVDGTLMMEDLSGIDCVMGSTHVFPGGFGFWFEPIHIDDPRLRRRLVQDWFDWVEQLVAREEIDILAHPGCEIAARALIPSFAEDWLRMRMVHLGGMMARHKVAFELNEALLHKLPSACAATYGEFVRTVAAQGVKFAIGTDSHRPATIGRYAWVMELVDNAGLRTRDFLRLERGRRG